jgi:hypothetical protein
MKLTPRLQSLLMMDAKMCGTCNVDEGALLFIEEQLTPAEYDGLEKFYRWLVKNNRTFGWNLPEVWKEYQNERVLTNKKEVAI